MLINNDIYAPDILMDATGTVVICSVRFAQEIAAQVKSINDTLKIIMLK